MNFEHFATPFIVMCAFIALDVISGLIAAFATKSVNSSKMRAGMTHKLAFFIAFALAAALEIASEFMELGIQVPAVGAIVVYIVTTEVVSILENICKINPELREKGFLALFGKSPE